MISRRCTERKFLLRPSEHTDEAFVYCFAIPCQRYDVAPLWLMVMSNHHDAGVWDKHESSAYLRPGVPDLNPLG